MITNSEEQFKYVRSLIAQKKLEDKLNVFLKDFQDISNFSRYDKVISIEMIESLPSQKQNDLLVKIKSTLKKDGEALIQSIVISDENYERYIRRLDFIQLYIFPGGALPSNKRFAKLIKNNGFDIVDIYSFGDSYEKTIGFWEKSFSDNRDKIKNLRFSNEFIRTWLYYFAYSKAGFNTKHINVSQFVIKNS